MLQSALDFLVGELLDTLLLRDLQLLLGVDFALAGIAEGVLEQELRALGVDFGLEEAFSRVCLNALQCIVDNQPVFCELLIIRCEVHDDLRPHSKKQPEAGNGVVLVVRVAIFEVLVNALAEESRPWEALLDGTGLEVLAGLCALRLVLDLADMSSCHVSYLLRQTS